MEDLYAQFIAFIDAHYMPTGVGFAAGLFAQKFIPYLKVFAAKTPTKLDDMIVAGIEACLAKEREKINAMTVKELDGILTTDQIAELVKLRRAKITAEKAVAK